MLCLLFGYLQREAGLTRTPNPVSIINPAAGRAE
jgi:hypothetical protein